MTTVADDYLEPAEVTELLDRYDGTVTVEDRRFPYDESRSALTGTSRSCPGSTELDAAAAKDFFDREIRSTGADIELEMEEQEETYRIAARIDTDDLDERWFGGRWKRYRAEHGQEQPDEHELYRLHLDRDDLREPGEPPTFDGGVVYV